MCLLGHHGEIVSVETLLETVWSGRSGEPAYVRKAIHEIRTALKDGDGQIVKTVPKVGYVIESRVVEETEGAEDTPDPPTSTSGQTFIYGRLSAGAYNSISRRLRRKRKDTTR